MAKGIFSKRGVLQIYVPFQSGYAQRSTGTTDMQLARKIKRMCEVLHDKQRYDVLSLIRSGRIGLTDCFAAYAAETLEQMLTDIATPDLTAHLDGWQLWVGNAQTAATYRAQVETLVSGPMKASELTRKKVSEWLGSLVDVSPGTRRKYLYALRSFLAFLREREVIASDYDPTLGVKRPEKNPPRMRYETEEVDISIVEAAPAEYRALFAFIHASGAEVSPALSALWMDLDLVNGTARVRGTKNAQRDRPDVVIEAWALPYLRAHQHRLGRSQSELAGQQVWPEMSRHQAHWHHQSTCVTLKIADYTLRDSRHSWAVRARRSGVSFEHIADQLGHVDTSLAHKVYGRFKRTIEDRILGSLTATTTATNGNSGLPSTPQPIAQALLMQ
jgi:integrase